YYIPMAFHFYNLVYARLAGGADPTRAATFRERARQFAHDFIHWFAADGAAVPFGRSLTYRFAQCAFWGALAFADVEALPWPVIKGLYLRHLRWWLKQPIFSETGLLSIGYAYPNLLMAESYNSPGSPYWALKTFLPLALPADHPFWQADEAPLPRRRMVHTVPGASLVLMTQPGARDVTALSPGQPVLEWPRHAPHKYSKCSYSSRFAFAVPASVPTATEGGLDNGLSLSDDGRFFRVREHCLGAAVHDGVAYSRHHPWPEIEVATWLLAASEGHVRVHRIRTDRRLWTCEGGFPVGYTSRATVESSADPVSGVMIRTPEGAAALRSLTPPREGEAVHLGANSSLMSSLAIMPLLRSILPPGEHWLVTWVGGSADARDPFSAALAYSATINASRCHLLRQGQRWWSSAPGDVFGESSTHRLEELETMV
ncbi:MAG TPA: DUF2264 domain-containing protein, partial [Candidatus Synoicihabitans sp.]|nr:DUF2264 domain-containing protein [Candidatus Synoicihabitans sp.]